MSPALAIAPLNPNIQSLESDRRATNDELAALVLPPGSKPTPFRKAMEYATFGSGQRLRPILASRISRALGIESQITLRAGAAVELIHCASLIVDDLPCMDDETQRRGRPATHMMYGESTALLAAFGLVGLAGRCLLAIPTEPSATAAILSFQRDLLGVLDLAGLCEGQDMDLRLQGDERALMRSRINELKTVPLFGLSGQAGALPLDPHSPDALAAVDFACCFGRAYQLVDDYIDGEITNRGLAVTAIRKARAALELLPQTSELHELLDYLEQRTHGARQ